MLFCGEGGGGVGYTGCEAVPEIWLSVLMYGGAVFATDDIIPRMARIDPLLWDFVNLLVYLRYQILCISDIA